MDKNSIFVRRKGKLIVNQGPEKVLCLDVLATALKNIEKLGFMFSEKLINAVRTMNEKEFLYFYNTLIHDLQEMTGENRSFRPMYPNFPTQVMDMEEAELYLNAIVHYFSVAVRDSIGINLPNNCLPIYEKVIRSPLIERTDLRILDLAIDEDFILMIQNLISAKSSISEIDKQDIAWAIEQMDDPASLLPDSIPLKENIGYIVAQMLQFKKADVNVISRYFDTATEVLRLAVALSGGDISLASNTRFKSFNRPERRLLMTLLDSVNHLEEDMLRHKEAWKRLGERLHPGEFKSKYSKVYEAFEAVRGNVAFQTFGGKLEHVLGQKDAMAAVTLLKKRPGDFARRLDHIIRISEEPQQVVKSFSEVVGSVSTRVLLQVHAHFKNRNNGSDIRVFFPKGNVGKAISITNELIHIEEEICCLVVSAIEEELVTRFSKLPPFGKVFVDKELQDYLVPFSQRSASRSIRTISRGSQLKIPDGDTIRAYVWWRNMDGDDPWETRVDLDLSVTIFDEKWKFMDQVSYTNLRSNGFRMFHSGDITDAPKGAAEFIDMDIPSIVKNGGRYVIVNVNCFTGQSYGELPECFAGWMIRKEARSGEIFEPKTVVDKFDITADTQICIPVIFDLAERKAIWSDIALRRNPNYAINIEGNLIGIAATGKSLTSLTKPTLYDLFMLHANARGTLVEIQKEADTIFSVNEGITPFEIEKILADFLV
ncbi:TerD family protein [Bacillus sp. UNC438CL73TsuS30]|uniref:TerD family protein n=1 Tax=Bacillus sp. UNC438CL73TsuS30 TaxID=1340434 RepID=UPI000557F7C9|nr:TerD family protein [Bacillus sp. UNC438CL73TsuS30]